MSAEPSAAALDRLRTALAAKPAVTRACLSGGKLMLELEHVEPGLDDYREQIARLVRAVTDALASEGRRVSLGLAPSEAFQRLQHLSAGTAIYERAEL